jgi:hypothetical protein
LQLTMNQRNNNLSSRRIGLCWEATRAPRWTRIPQAGAEVLRPGRPAYCGFDHNAINPGQRGKTSTKTKRISNLTAVRDSDIHAEPVHGDPLYLTDATESGFRLTAANPEFARKMKVAERLSRRYRHALKELAK